MLNFDKNKKVLLKNKIKLLFDISINLIMRLMCVLLTTKDYWVICERGCEARDNAYFFYEYMKRAHPKQKVYYVIDSKSSDYYKVKDDAIEYRSLKTIFRVYRARKIISTHYASVIYNLPRRFFGLSGLQSKFYFLQHGIIKDKLPSLYFRSAPMKLFVCGAYPEYLYVRNNFGHPQNVVKYTGLARFDNLHNISKKKQILVMPTWRNWCDADFEKTQYYKCWNELLNNKLLVDCLEKYNVDLVFYPHYEIQKHIKLFNSTSDKVIIARFEDYDVQTLLKESALLITDYSSVYFDFGYMKKPVVYYQFDKDRFFSQHYNRGYFDYETMGFGKVCESLNDVLTEIDNIIHEDFEIDSCYLKRIEMFFPLHDDKNCERIYDVIVESNK